jgi:hypothetical protein
VAVAQHPEERVDALRVSDRVLELRCGSAHQRPYSTATYRSTHCNSSSK